MFNNHIWPKNESFKLFFILTFFTIIIDLILLIQFIIKNRYKTNLKLFDKKFFELFIFSDILYSFFTSFVYFFEANPSYINYFKIAVYASGIIYNIVIILFHITFRFSTNSRIETNYQIDTIFNFIVIFVFVLFVSLLCTGNFIVFNTEGHLIKQKLYFLSKLICPLLLFYDIYLLLKNRKIFSKMEITGWSCFFILPLINIPLGLFFTNIFYQIGFFLSIFVIEITIDVIEFQSIIVKENISIKSILKTNKAQTDIVISQIQPHFIFNSLASISALCDVDPHLAQEATNKFSSYFRTNLNSIKEEKLISFEQEFEHIQTYLWLEKIRFDNRLNVEYNILVKDFSVPSLSLQPIVENAIKNGICQKPEGGTVTISTLETIKEYRIIIKDDCNGFNMVCSPEGDQVHIGLRNCQERIKNLCNGSVEIKTSIGNGTTVTVRIPKIHQE